jgi:hypothetical protein
VPAHISENPAPIQNRALKRTYAVLGKALFSWFADGALKTALWPTDINAVNLVPQVAAPLHRLPRRTNTAPIYAQGHRTTSTLLELLDSRVRPGVTEAEFRKLFVCASANISLPKEHIGGMHVPRPRSI